MASQKIFVRQVRSCARTKDLHIKTLKALGLGKIGKTNILPDNSAMRGMIRAVVHWIEVRSV